MKKSIRLLLSLPGSIFLGFISYLPGEVGFFLRQNYWSKRLRNMGARVRIDTGVFFQNPSYISLGENTWIDKNTIIMAGVDKSTREKIVLKNEDFIFEKGSVFIGSNVHIPPFCIVSGIDSGVYISDGCGLAANCKIYAFSHHYRSVKDPQNRKIIFGSMAAHQEQCMMSGPVFLGKNVGLALNSVVLPGVSILEDSFVSINSVVHRGRYPVNSMLEGSPATVVGERFKERKINGD